jgi:hypothetical protein
VARPVKLDLDVLSQSLMDRTPARSEATVQSDIRTLLVYGSLDLQDSQVVPLEVPLMDTDAVEYPIPHGAAVGRARFARLLR